MYPQGSIKMLVDGVVFTIAGLGSKYRLDVGAAVKVAEPSRLAKRTWPALVYSVAVGVKLEDGLFALFEG